MTLRHLRMHLMVLMIVVTGAMIAVFACHHVSENIFWRSHYNQGLQLGENCFYGFADGKVARNLAVLGQVQAWYKHKMPYRDSVPKPFPLGDLLVTHCKFDLSKLRSNKYAELRLGIIVGDSTVFLNNRLLFVQDDDAYANVPLSPMDLVHDADLLIISKIDGANPWPGLSSSRPIIASDQRDILGALDVAKIFFYVEGPAVKFAVLATFFLLLAAAWLCGIRYGDIGYGLILLMLTMLGNYYHYSPSLGRRLQDYFLAQDIFSFIPVVFYGFNVRFLRLEKSSIRLFTESALLALSIVLMTYVIDIGTYSDIFSTPGITRMLGSLFLIPGIVGGFRVMGALTDTRRLRVWLFVGMNIFCLISLFFNGLTYDLYLLNIDSLVVSIDVALIALMLIADLSILHRKFLAERMQRQIAEQRVERNKAMVESVGMIAHDFMRPVAMADRLIGSLEHGSNPQLSSHLHQDLVEPIKAAAAQARRLASDIIEIAKPEQLQLGEVSLFGMIRGVVRQLEPGSSVKKIDVLINEEHVRTVIGDSAKLCQVFQNLLENAIQSTPDNGKITISTSDIDSLVLVRIHNSGSYISPENMTRLFDPFFTRRLNGTGLGLAIVEKIVALHKGRISCESNKETGTAFLVELNAGSIDKFADLRLEEMPKHALPANSLVVVIEDDPFFLSALKVRLPFHRVHSFSSPKELYASQSELTGQNIGAVICDCYDSVSDFVDVVKLHGIIRQFTNAPLILTSEVLLPGPLPRLDSLFFLLKADILRMKQFSVPTEVGRSA